MASSMTSGELQLALNYMIRNSGLKLPYDFLPGMEPGEWNPPLTEDEWNTYQWNPPSLLPMYSEADSTASEKPTWQEIVDAVVLATLISILRVKLQELRQECQNRICLNYGENTLNDEILKRLRNGHTAEQDTERERLRTKYTTIKASIAAMNYSTLNSFDVSLDSLWSA